MTKYGSADIGFFLVGGYSLLGYQTDLNVKKSKVTEQDDTLGDSWEEHGLVGLERAEISQNGFYDDESKGNNEALLADVGTSRVLCLGHEGNVIGRGFIGFAGSLQVDYERKYERGAFTKAAAMYQGVGAVEEGVVLHELSEETADGDTESTPHDNSASSADGGAGYLQVKELTLGGYDDVVVKIRDSSDDITYGDLITFTAAAAVGLNERKTVAGTIERYTATSWAFSGSGSDPTVTFMAGVYRN